VGLTSDKREVIEEAIKHYVLVTNGTMAGIGPHRLQAHIQHLHGRSDVSVDEVTEVWIDQGRPAPDYRIQQPTYRSLRDD